MTGNSMKKYLALCVTTALICMTQAYAQEVKKPSEPKKNTAEWKKRACLIEAKGMINLPPPLNLYSPPKEVDVKDCMRNDALSEEQFVMTCETLATQGEKMGMPKATLTYVGECPSMQQATCVVPDTYMTWYYYKGDPEFVEGRKQSCLAQKGTWRK
jgi:hypothetical protein